MPKLKIRARRKFTQTTGTGDDRRTVVHQGGTVVDVTDAQARNFADIFEDPNAAAQTSGETLTPEEQEALSTFRAEKRRQAEEEAAKVAAGTDRAGAKVIANEDAPSSTAKTADESAQKPAPPAPKK